MILSDMVGAERVNAALESAIANRTLSKAVLSRPRDKSKLRAVIALFEKAGEFFERILLFCLKNIQCCGIVYNDDLLD